MRKLLIPLLLLSAVGLAGCIDALSQQPPTPIVTLANMTPEQPLYQDALPQQLMVSAPEASGGLDSDRIAAIFYQRELRYLGNAKWPGPLPRFIQQCLVDYIRASGRFSGVGTPTSGMNTPYRLNCDIKFLGLSYAGRDEPPTAQIRLTLTLMDNRKGLILAEKTVTTVQAASRDSFNDNMDALDHALHLSMLEATRWTTETMTVLLNPPKQAQSN